MSAGACCMRREISTQMHRVVGERDSSNTVMVVPGESVSERALLGGLRRGGEPSPASILFNKKIKKRRAILNELEYLSFLFSRLRKPSSI